MLNGVAAKGYEELRAIRHAHLCHIGTHSGKRQWTAITAELAGMPLPQIALKLEMNTNSIYKLLHDARKKLRRGLESSGFTIEDIHEAWA
jgi:hypothetical protein